jgi:hypothetical protein
MRVRRPFHSVLPIEIARRTWEIHFSADKDVIIDRTDALLPWIALIAGLVSSALLFVALYSLASSRSRAVAIAEVITKDLRESEASLAEAQRIARLGNWSLDRSSGIMTWSAETYRISASIRIRPYRHDEFLKRSTPGPARASTGLENAITLNKAARSTTDLAEDGTVR